MVSYYCLANYLSDDACSVTNSGRILLKCLPKKGIWLEAIKDRQTAQMIDIAWNLE